MKMSMSADIISPGLAQPWQRPGSEVLAALIAFHEGALLASGLVIGKSLKQTSAT